MLSFTAFWSAYVKSNQYVTLRQEMELFTLDERIIGRIAYTTKITSRSVH